ncbi:MAG: RdgB/HAM1 family non-canonical purine NTP pyrophosphatase [Enterobacterales bacterium]|nr:RdgB/HAM1 family non-canonical purine NTP pyrophosphatase [Enterobacterales bacterium]
MSNKAPIIIASGNNKKLTEFGQILASQAIELLPQSNFKIPEAIEDGLTFVENALIKARHASQLTQMPAIADDSGIEVDYLKGNPGIYSARFAADDATDQQNLEKLLNDLEPVSREKRTARYQCVIVYLRHWQDPTPIICQASWQGLILTKPVGDGGFGYDPIFYCPQAKKSAAQMSAQEKHALSHRGKALRLFAKAFNEQSR